MRTKNGTTKKTRKNTDSIFSLKHSHRRFLKKPFGQLCAQKNVLAAAAKAKVTVSVGDATTLFFLSNSLVPSVAIVDFLEKRSPTSESHSQQILSVQWGKFFVARNAPGTLSSGALLAVSEAISFASARSVALRKALVVIDGEEDLVFLAAVLHAPKGALLFYGQPGKGIVMLQATAESKKIAEKLLGEAFDLK